MGWRCSDDGGWWTGAITTKCHLSQVESGGEKNCRAITGCSMFCDMHILTRESQEVMGTKNVLTGSKASDITVAERSRIF